MSNESKLKFYPVGSTFEYQGVKLKVKANPDCEGCVSMSALNINLCGKSQCSCSDREDSTSVVFSRIKDKPKKDKNVVIGSSDGCTTKAEVDGSGNITVSSVYGYSDNVDTLCTLVDNGNGYHVTSKSYSSATSYHIFNLDYAEIEYIYLAYKALKKSKKEKK